MKTEFKTEKQDFPVRDKMILPFFLLAASSATLPGSYVAGARTESRRHPAVSPGVTPGVTPGITPASHDILLFAFRESISCLDSPVPPALLREVTSPKGELLIAHTPLCSEIGSSLSAKVLLLALAETWPPFALFPYCLVPHICLPSLSHIFPSLTLKLYYLLISLSLSFAMM